MVRPALTCRETKGTRPALVSLVSRWFCIGPSRTNTLVRDKFHQAKDVFIELGIREHFNIPKLHGLAHYRRSITVFGTADNYNTEQSERLHIDFTKKAYRATNCKDEFKQMVTWVERQEAMHHCAVLIELRKSSPTPPPIHPTVCYPEQSTLYPFLAIHPSEKGISFDSLANRYGAVDFKTAWQTS